jgi:hypothetical protein
MTILLLSGAVGLAWCSGILFCSFSLSHDGGMHHQAERAKFLVTGNRSYIRVFQDLVNQQILLLPFTVDHLGGIGTLGHRLLFSHNSHKAPQPITTKPSNHHSLLLYNAAYNPLAPTDLL